MFWGIEYDFWLLRVWIPGAVSGNCLVTNGLREVWLLCCFDVRWTCLPVLASGGDSGISKGTFALAGVYAASFAALCTTAWCDVAGACPRNNWAHPGGSIVQARIHRNIAKQRLPGNPTDLRQFPDHSLPGAFFFRSQKSYWKPCHIRNSLGTIYFLVWEVWVIKYSLRTSGSPPV